MPETKISWTDEAINFLTWNCHKVSQGCKHCYAQAHAAKYPQNSAGGQFLGAPKMRPNAVDELRKTAAGTVLFVNTHSDTFHEALPLADLKFMFQHMNQRPDLIFLLLTKRPFHARMLGDQLNWTDNIWLGTSIENMDVYDARLTDLLETPAQHRFISFEPLLGPIVPDGRLMLVNWIITGGESGEYRRPFGYQWAVDVQDFCARHAIPFFHKQGSAVYPDQDIELGGKTYRQQPDEFHRLHDKYRVDVSQPTLF